MGDHELSSETKSRIDEEEHYRWKIRKRLEAESERAGRSKPNKILESKLVVALIGGVALALVSGLVQYILSIEYEYRARYTARLDRKYEMIEDLADSAEPGMLAMEKIAVAAFDIEGLGEVEWDARLQSAVDAYGQLEHTPNSLIVQAQAIFEMADVKEALEQLSDSFDLLAEPNGDLVKYTMDFETCEDRLEIALDLMVKEVTSKN